MKEQIDTIPVNEAFEAGDECPFCHMERQAEQTAIRYVVGPCASYMEPLVRGATNRAGFCRQHYKKMFDYGNSLGSALIMQTYMVGLQKELQVQMDSLQILSKRGLFAKKPKGELPLLAWAKGKNSTCYLCQIIDSDMHRYYATFFHLIKGQDFRAKVEGSKGFCMHHFEKLLEAAQEKLPSGQIEWFYTTILNQMLENLGRVQGDLDWFVEKFDYRNASAPWNNSRDAVSRSMQKLKGGYPSDNPFKQN